MSIRNEGWTYAGRAAEGAAAAAIRHGRAAAVALALLSAATTYAALGAVRPAAGAALVLFGLWLLVESAHER